MDKLLKEVLMKRFFLFAIFIVGLILFCSFLQISTLKNNDNILPDNKEDFEKAFMKDAVKGEVRAIPVRMEKNLLIDDKKEHFVINDNSLYSYVNFKVETIEKDGYIAVSNSRVQGNQCAFIAYSDTPLYIWQEKRFSIITQSKDIRDPDVLSKPYCQSFILPPNTYYKVVHGYSYPSDNDYFFIY